MSSALITSRATKSTLPKPSERPSSMLLAPVHSSPEKISELSWSRLPRPFLTTSMNCLWISSSIDWAWRFCFSSTGENGSRKALFSPEVRAGRSTPGFSIVPVKPAPVEHEQHQQREIGKTEQLEKDAPAAGAALLLESDGRQRLDHVPFPVTFGHADHPS